MSLKIRRVMRLVQTILSFILVAAFVLEPVGVALAADQRAQNSQMQPGGKPHQLPDDISAATASDLTPRAYFPLLRSHYVPPLNTTITPGGGQIDASGDGLRVNFEAGAVTQSAQASYQPRPPFTPPSGYRLIGLPFNLSLLGADNQPITHLLPQVTVKTVDGMEEYLVTPRVTISQTYDPAALDGLDESRLRLYYRTSDGRWLPMLTLVDSTSHQVQVPTDHFTDFALFAPTAAITDTLVVIDPDHGGSDPGGTVNTPASYAIEEKMVNLQTAQSVAGFLQACGVQVEMTRQDDSSLSGPDRAAFINQLAPDLAATIGTNIVTHDMAYFVGGPMGLADYAKPGDVDLAQFLVHAISDTTSLPGNRGVKDAATWRGGVYLPTHVPGVLYAQIETAYLDSYNDRDKVIDPHLDYIAGGIYNGIVQQLGLQAQCPPFGDVILDDRAGETLGINNYSAYTAQGVNPVTGNQFHWSRDLFVPGPGLNFDLVRYYNSQSTDEGLFGLGWSSLYDMRITPQSDGGLEVRYADGHTAIYTPDGSGGYTPPAGEFDLLQNIGGGFALTTPSQVRMEFDAAGALQSIADQPGNRIALHYSGSLLDWIEDAAGRRIEADTDAAGHITRLVDPGGREVSYSYGLVSLEYTQYLQNLRRLPLSPQAGNQLLGMTDARQGGTGYDYDPAGGYLQRVTDPMGMSYLENVYTPDGRVAEQRDGKGEQGKWDYQLDQMRAIYTDNEGRQTTYLFDSQYRVIEEIDALGQHTKYEYDDHDNMTAMTDKRGNTWRYTYDERGNKLTQTDPLDQWSLYDTDVTTWTYDDKNNPTSMTDSLGYLWRYEYDSKGNPTKVTEPNGAVTTAEYDDKGHMTRLVDAAGRITRYEYDSNGNLTRTWDAAGGWSASTYDNSGHQLTFTECINPPSCSETRTTHYQYDGNGNITKVTDPLGAVTTTEYDKNNMPVKKTDRRGGVWEYKYDENLNPTWEKDPLGRIREYTYDKMSHRLTAKDPKGQVTSFEYDAIYRLIRVYEPGGFQHQYAYDPNGNLLAYTDPAHHQTRFVYDVANRRKFVYDAIGGVTEYCYDSLDRIIRVFDPRRAKTDIRYDDVGNMVEVIDPMANRTTFGFDRVHNRTRLTSGIPSYGQESDGNTTLFEYDALNREVKVTDPIGRATATTYDGVSNVRFVTDPKGQVSEYRYNLNGWATDEINALGETTHAQYDPEGALRFSTDAKGHASEYRYDLAGQMTHAIDPLGQTTEYRYDLNGNQTQVIDAQGGVTRYDYDARNQVTDDYDPLNNHTHYTYNALRQLTAVTDANGKTTQYAYNPLGWLTSVTDPTNGVTRYEYDIVGNRTQIIDAQGVETNFEYNWLNQLTREINPLGDIWQYSYDPSGNMVRKVDGKWQAIYYTYDKASQLIETTYGVGSGGVHRITFEYDPNGNEIAMHDWNGDWTYTYDALNRRTSAVDYKGRKLSWSYDAAGNRATMTYPDGRSVQMTYDAADRLDTLADLQGCEVDWDYNALGMITQQTNPNGTQVTYSYDAAGRLTNLVNSGPDAATIAAYIYQMDPVGNRISTVEQRGMQSITRSYTYDDLYRLVRAQSTAGQDMSYVYDPVGNRLQKHGLPESGAAEDTTYTFNDLNSMLSAGPVTFDYDANGSRIRKTEPITATAYLDFALAQGWALTSTLVTSYTYDYENRLVDVTSAIQYTAQVTYTFEITTAQGLTVTTGITYTSGLSETMHADYTYDGYGRRIEKWVTTSITATGVLTQPQALHRDYIFDGLEPVVEYEFAGETITPTLTANYVYGNGRMVVLERTEAGSAPQSYWYHYDALGSIVSLTGVSGQEICQWQYDEYGNPSQSCLESNRYTYTGQEFDQETQMLHFYARYYDTDLGIWLSQDIYPGEDANPMTWHRYMYSANNPINLIDYYGYNWWDDFTGWASDTANDAWEATTDAANDTWNNITQTANDAWNTVTTTANNVSNNVSQAANNFVDWTSNTIDQGINLVDQNIVQPIAQTTTQIAHYVNDNVIQPAVSVVQDAADWIQENKALVAAGVGFVAGGIAAGAFCGLTAGLGCLALVGLAGGALAAGGTQMFANLADRDQTTGWNNFLFEAMGIGGVTGLIGGVTLGRGIQNIRAGGNLQRMSQLVKEAQAKYPKLAGKMQKHHVYPKYLGGNPGGKLVNIDAAYHQTITNAIRARFPFGKGPFNPAQVAKGLAEVYKMFPIP